MALHVLKEHQFYSKFSKCIFQLSLVAFHGNIISGDYVKVDPKKTDAVRNWPRPLILTDISILLCLYKYYRIFVDVYSSIASPLKFMTQKKMKFELSEACEKGFQEFKYKLTSALVLTLLEGNEEFVVYCDASQGCLGCVFMHHCKVMAYHSRHLKFM